MLWEPPYLTVPRDVGKMQKPGISQKLFFSFFLFSLYILLTENHEYGVWG
jgi:hypothetical protein